MKRLLLFIMLAETLLSFTQDNLPKLLDRYMQAQATQNDFCGTVLSAKKGKVIYGRSLGLADR